MKRRRKRVREPVLAARLASGELETELGRDHDLVAYRLERLADEFLLVDGP
jgi:hypothetical protein